MVELLPLFHVLIEHAVHALAKDHYELRLIVHRLTQRHRVRINIGKPRLVHDFQQGLACQLAGLVWAWRERWRLEK